ncbi:uncharacterized protein BX664DRAFT_346705 [Halteromyces radiatus]|uniref:uncharacterized protein n=1 Tax=Halteromyces radiatus TaxID=101107 RepID=UPI00221E8B13|nr:uncharacterized protein BX664DRAFT_346705 [Halteromyces radiatus]KAI8096653.1 hypothetical protein BX664DRAFT_346705 [Halteromyces radiatus]
MTSPSDDSSDISSSSSSASTDETVYRPLKHYKINGTQHPYTITEDGLVFGDNKKHPLKRDAKYLRHLVQLWFRVNGKKQTKTVCIDECMLSTFGDMDEPDPEMVIVHLNGDHKDDRLINLRYMNKVDHVQHLMEEEHDSDAFQVAYIKSRRLGIGSEPHTSYVATTFGDIYGWPSIGKCVKLKPTKMNGLLYKVNITIGSSRIWVPVSEIMVDTFREFDQDGSLKIFFKDKNPTNLSLENVIQATFLEYQQTRIAQLEEIHHPVKFKVALYPKVSADYLTNYLVSSVGTIYSLTSERFLTDYEPYGTTYDGIKYKKPKKVSLSNGSDKYKTMRVHILVKSSHHGIEEGKVVHHIDHNTHNNRLENLKWATISENAIEAIKFYRAHPDQRPRIFKTIGQPQLRHDESFRHIGGSVPGRNYKDYYVSQYGTLKRKTSNRSTIFAISKSPDGYVVYYLYDDNTGKLTRQSAHRLVCFVFNGSSYSPEKTQVDHIDGIRDNNYYLNLRFVSPRENVQGSSKVGCIVYLKNDPKVVEQFESISAAYEFFGVKKSHTVSPSCPIKEYDIDIDGNGMQTYIFHRMENDDLSNPSFYFMGVNTVSLPDDISKSNKAVNALAGYGSSSGFELDGITSMEILDCTPNASQPILFHT